MLYSISQKELSALNETELERLNENIINELKQQRNILSQEFNKLLKERYQRQREIEDTSENLRELNQRIAELEAEKTTLQRGISQYFQSDRAKQAQINSLGNDLSQLREQQRNWSAKENHLFQQLNRKNGEIAELRRELDRYSQVRIPEGMYMGNISSKNSKYHYNERCPDWKMLVGEYVLNLSVGDSSRAVRSSATPSIFLREGLGECDVCSGRRKSRK